MKGVTVTVSLVRQKTHMDWAGVATGIRRRDSGYELREPCNGRFAKGFRKNHGYSVRIAGI
jgi:hypothetical protein